MTIDLRKLAEAFMAWPLPETVRSDLCAIDPSYKFPRRGTNLLALHEMEEFFRYAESEGLLTEESGEAIDSDALKEAVKEEIAATVYDTVHSLSQPSMKGKSYGEIIEYQKKYINESIQRSIAGFVRYGMVKDKDGLAEMIAKLPIGYVCKFFPPSQYSAVWDCVIKPECHSDTRQGIGGTGLTPTQAMESAMRGFQQ